MDPDAPTSDNAPSRSTLLDTALRIGLVALLIYACGRIILPFAGILFWSVILAVMLYPLHVRLVVWLGNRWSALSRSHSVQGMRFQRTRSLPSTFSSTRRSSGRARTAVMTICFRPRSSCIRPDGRV